MFSSTATTAQNARAVTIRLDWGQKQDGTFSGLNGHIQYKDAYDIDRKVGIETDYMMGTIYMFAMSLQASDFMKACKSLCFAFEQYIRWDPRRAHQSRLLANLYCSGKIVFFVSCPEQAPPMLIKTMAAREFLPIQFVLFDGNLGEVVEAGDPIRGLRPYMPSLQDRDIVKRWMQVPVSDHIPLNTFFIDTLKRQLAKVALEDLKRWQFEAKIPDCGFFEDKFVIHFDGSQFVEASTLRPIVPDISKNDVGLTLLSGGAESDFSGRKGKKSKRMQRLRLGLD